jgi:hypothetical protein
LPVQNLPKIQTVEQARDVLLGMAVRQEIVSTSDEGKVSIKKHGDYEFSAYLVDHETGIISLRDASHILLEHGDHELHFA